MRRAATILPILLLCAGAAAAEDRYHVRWDPEAETVAVEACFDGRPPAFLERHGKAADFTSGVRHRGRPLGRSDRERLDLANLPDHACIDWRVAIGQAADEAGRGTALRSGSALLTATSLWFWTARDPRPVTVTVRVPEGHGFSTPWPAADGVEGAWRPVPSPGWWSSRTVFGRFEQQRLEVDGGRLDLALAGDFDRQQTECMVRWLSRSAAAVAPVLGRFPRERVQVIVVPIGARSEPVPWAHVLRGGGPAVEFFVDPHRPLAEFDADWTATHEFSHLLLPYVAYNDRWLSEGLASYYQNVLRARDGRLSELEAWQALHAGFGRGRRATRDETLRQATRSGRGATMRIYWAGAALALEADVGLRKASAGALSLDLALRRFNACCVEPGATWRAEKLLAKLEELTGLGVFSRLGREYPGMRRFPELEPLYRDLGLRDAGGPLRLAEDAARADLRDDIMRGGEARPGTGPRRIVER